MWRGTVLAKLDSWLGTINELAIFFKKRENHMSTVGLQYEGE